MPVYLHYQQDRLSSVLKGCESNIWLFFNAHIYKAETCQMHVINKCKYACKYAEKYQMHKTGKCKYAEKYKHIWRKHVFVECAHANMHKIVMRIWQTLVYNIQKRVRSIYLMKAHMEIHRKVTNAYMNVCMQICRKASNAYIWQMQIWNVSNAYIW